MALWQAPTRNLFHTRQASREEEWEEGMARKNCLAKSGCLVLGLRALPGPFYGNTLYKKSFYSRLLAVLTLTTLGAFATLYIITGSPLEFNNSS